MNIFQLILMMIVDILLIVLLEIVPLKIIFAASSEVLSDLRIVISWLNPMIKGIISKNCEEMMQTLHDARYYAEPTTKSTE